MGKFKNILKGGLKGLGAGLMTGNPLAAVIGAGTGAIIGGLEPVAKKNKKSNGPQQGSAWSGTPAHPGGIIGQDIYGKDQLDKLKSLLQSGYNGLQNPLTKTYPEPQPNQGSFEPIKQNALSTFQRDILPYIQNQFNSVGGQRSANHFSSGTFAAAATGAGASLSDRLAAAQAAYDQNNQQNYQTNLYNTRNQNQAALNSANTNYMNQLNMGLGQRNQYFNQPGQQAQPGMRDNLMNAAINHLPDLAKLGYQGYQAFSDWYNTPASQGSSFFNVPTQNVSNMGNFSGYQNYSNNLYQPKF
jgi:hypothetical protein